jgi:hypothetical protein
MSELRPKRCGQRNEPHAVGVARLAGRQEGVVKEVQLREVGLNRFAVRRWVQAGRLHRLFPGVYAVGHTALTTRGQLVAGLFYAGDGAALSHGTATHWWSLIRRPPDLIHISMRHHRKAVAGLVLHRPRHLERVFLHRIPVTPVARTLLDFAANASHNEVRKALANADYRNLLRLPQLGSTMGKGLPGSATLRRAVDAHLPQLAETNGPLEEEFMFVCERAGIPIPLPNHWVGDARVDALWPDERVVVELDSKSAHGSDAQRMVDHQRDMKLRDLGYTVRRYSWYQVFFTPDAVIADLTQTLAARRGSAPGTLR